MVIRKDRQTPNAFTLIELLVVIAIISLLVSILLPSLHQAKELAKRVLCQTNERAIGLAVGMYTTEFDGYLAPAIWGPLTNGPDIKKEDCWRYNPMFMDQYLNVSSEIGDLEGVESAVVICPSDDQLENRHLVRPQFARTSYQENVYCGRDEVWIKGTPGPGFVRLSDIKSPTGMIAFGDCDYPYNLNPLRQAANHAASIDPLAGNTLRHSGGWNVLFLDGHAEYRDDYIEFSLIQQIDKTPTWRGL